MSTSGLKYYQHAIYHIETIRNAYKFLFSTLTLPKKCSLSVMDIGIASGRALNEVVLPLLPNNVHDVIGTDINENMLEFSRSMNKDSRISFEKLDIETEKIPKHFERRFDLLVSSYCFSYVRNWKQAFTNCKRLLKADGNLLLISQIKTNALFTTYRKMASMERWKSYTGDYKNYVPPLSEKDPDSELRQLLKDVGMELLSYKIDPEVYFDFNKKALLDVYLSLEYKSSTVPQNQQQAFSDDFIRILGEETHLDFTDETSLDDTVQFSFPSVFLHSKNVKI